MKATNSKIKKIKHTTPYIGTLFIAVPFGLFIVGWWGVRPYLDRYVNPDWPRVDALVVGYDYQYDHGLKARNGMALYVPKYIFWVNAERPGKLSEYSGIAEIGHHLEPDKSLHHVTVAYNPDNPSESKQVTDTTKRAVQLIVYSIIGGLIMVVPLRKYIADYIKMRRASHR